MTTTSEVYLKNPDNNEESSSSSCIKKPAILISIIAGAVVVIVVVVVLVVVLTKDDDSSESSVVDDDISDIGDERWIEAYKKAKNFLKPFSYDEKYRLFYGEFNISTTCVGALILLQKEDSLEFVFKMVQQVLDLQIMQQHGKLQ